MKSYSFSRMVRYLVIMAVGIVLSAALTSPQIALAETETPDVPTGLSEFYIPVEADQLWDIFEDNDNNPDLGEAAGIHYVVAVTASTDNTEVYYDHWEDGYDFNEITLTGADESFTANQGTVLEFETTNVPVRPRGTGMNVCTSTHPPSATATTFCYDGRDRIYIVGGAATVTLAVWPQSEGTVYAFAWELFPTKPYQTTYTVPVGENLFGAPNNYDDFDNVYVLVQATTDGTTVQIDDPQTGPGNDVNVTLNKGEVTDLWHIWSGTTVNANFPVQVQFIVGQAQGGVGAETRGFTVVPATLWDDEYYAPVDGSVGAFGSDIYLYNPNASSITITWEDTSGTGSFALGAGATIAYSDAAGANHAVPSNSGVRLTATGIFWGVGTVDTEDFDYDWNYSLVPATALTTEYYVGWAPGTSDATPTNNCSPVWITAAQDNTLLQIDFGPTDGSYDLTTTVNQLDSLRVYDPDFDNSGMHIVASAPIAVAWGEADLNQSGANCAVTSPNMDLGYTVLPQLSAFIDVVLNIEKTANPSIIPNAAGETSEFTLVVSTDSFAVNDVDVTDLLPANWVYVDDSTTITFPDNSTLSGNAADPSIAGQLLTWDLNLDMLANETLTLVFSAITTAAPGSSTNFAEATGTYNGKTFTTNDSVLIDTSGLELTKTSSVNGTVYPGETIQYTMVVENVGSILQNNIILTDTLPTGTTYVAQSTTAVGPDTATSTTYRDEFGTAVYNNSNGTATWTSTPWVESGADAGGNAATGTTLITGGRLQFAGNAAVSRLHRPVNLNNAISATLTFDHFVNGTIEAGDLFEVEVSANGGSSWTTLQSFNGTITNNGSKSYDITAYANTNTWIRFSVTGFIQGTSPNDERLELDNVQVTYVLAGSTVTKDNIPGGTFTDLANGTPPNLVLTGDNFDLYPGQTLTVIYSVVVNDPTAAGLTSIDNTAFASSVEEPKPVQDSVTNPLPPSTIGDLVWLDVDGDGVYDIGEPGLPNVTVNLYDPGPDNTIGGGDDVLIATTLTDSNGNYLFTVPPGDYYVDVTTGIPSGLTTSPGTSDPTAIFTTTAGREYLDKDFGYTNSSAADAIIGDYVWSDADGDGVQDPGEPGLGGVTLELRSPGADGILGTGDDTVIGTTTTADDGTYYFTSVPPGDYIVVVTDTGGVLTGYTPTSGPQSQGGNVSVPITVVAGEVFLNADFGYQPPANENNSAGDLIWHDLNGNGVQDGGEPGISGVTVALLDASGDVVATTTTDSTGAYSFTGVPDGTYTVWVNDTGGVLAFMDQTFDPDEAAPCTTCDDRDSAVDLDAAGTNPAGVSVNTADFGYNQSGVIGDTVFSDNDGDGVQDPGEPGIGGVTVNLYLDDGDGIFEPGTDDTLLKSDVTATDGTYLFTSLGASPYWVSVDDTQGALTGYSATTTDGHPGTPNTTDTLITLPAGGSNLNADFGYQNTALANISGAVWNDQDENALDNSEPQIAGVTVGLVRDTDGDGVWEPNGADGIPGTSDDEPIIATDTTDVNGAYSFTDLPNGNYIVAVTDTAGVLTGYHLTNGLDKRPVTLAGTDVTDIDFGYDRNPLTGSIGDYVWFDADRDGVQDAAETGIPGVTVALYEDLNGNGVAEPGGADGAPVAFATTDANGNYNFSGLGAGNYFVDVTDTANQLTGLALTTGSTDPSSVINLSEGEDNNDADFGYADDTPASQSAIGDRVWYDADGDGVQDPGEVGITGVTVNVYDSNNVLIGTDVTDGNGFWLVTGLTSGGNYTVEVVTSTLPSGYNPTPTNGDATRTYIVNLGVDVLYADFGFNGGTTGSVGDTVYLDIDGDGSQGGSETGISGVTVNLYTDPNGDGDPSDGTLIGTTTTDANGNYLFSGLPAGASYVVEVTDVFSVLTGTNQTGDPDEGGTCSTCNNRGSATIPGGGGSALGVDFGYQPSGGSIGSFVWHDLNGDGDWDTGESGMEGITIELWLDMDNDGVIDPGFDNLLRTTATDENGEYVFYGLPPGNYLVDVTDANGVLSGFTKTTGASPGTNNNSQADPYDVTLTSGTPNNVTADFGYRAVTPFTLSGSVFNDLNQDALYDDTNPAPVEPFFTNVPMFLYRDLDSDGIIDPSDPLIGTTFTDANGDYIFTDLPNGNYLVATDAPSALPTGMIQTTQTATPEPAVQNVTIAGANVVDQDFGFYAPAIISDYVWHDDDGDGVQDVGEPGISGVVVYLYEDRDGDGIAEPGGDDGDPVLSTTTDTNGIYQFSGMKPAGYFVDFDLPAGYVFAPQNSTSDDLDSDADPVTGLSSVVRLGTGEIDVDFDAGLLSNLDYGDLPSFYNNTILGENGARHDVGTLRLGDGISTDIDTDPDGQESPSAAGDTEDDGVNRDMTDSWTNGATVDITIDLRGTTGSGQASVGLWIDWNGNGTFEASDFFPFTGLTVGAVNTVQITIPGVGTYAVGNTVNVRARAFDPASVPGGSLDISDSVGYALNGEVEDYQWTFSPTAITLTSLTVRNNESLVAVGLAGVLILGGALLLLSKRKSTTPYP